MSCESPRSGVCGLVAVVGFVWVPLWACVFFATRKEIS